MSTSRDFQSFLGSLAAAAESAVPAQAASLASDLADVVAGSGIDPLDKATVLQSCSSVVINSGADLDDADLLMAGQRIAQTAQDLTDATHPLYFEASYNLANAGLILSELELPRTATPGDDWETPFIADRVIHREGLRDARRQLFEVAISDVARLQIRSAAYCNLANTLDNSGRWAEAYDFYLLSVELDPTNGNAVGNLAQLLLRRVASGIGQTGHLAAVYDKYLERAQSMRDGTLKFAGERAAALWDGLKPTGSRGHLAHGLETDDAYRRWVATHRLALSPAVEGLGTEDPHWDNATVEALYGNSPKDLTPPLLAEMNVLKSDFIVARKLAYDGYVGAAEGPLQDPDDSGYYIETLDYSLYGTKYSKLLLAQRAVLDVLDKTAVVVNEYLGIGDRPNRVAFRTFWVQANGATRKGLVAEGGSAMAAHALGELALDMDKSGMYAPSQDLRNAGTHRIVHAAVLEADGVTSGARSRIDPFTLVDSTVLALQVTRSAYLYLIDLVATWNRSSDVSGNRIELPTHEYLYYLDDDSDEPGA